MKEIESSNSFVLSRGLVDYAVYLRLQLVGGKCCNVSCKYPLEFRILHAIYITIVL